jgi:hypothetical protein
MGLVKGAFGCAKEKIEGFAELFAPGADDGGIVMDWGFCVKKLGIVGLDETGPFAAGVDFEVKLDMVELDEKGPLGAGAGAEVCVVGIEAEGKGNKDPGAAVAVLPSGLSFASPGWEFEGGAGILNRGGGLGSSVTCELPFEEGSRENEGVVAGGATEGFSSGFGGKRAGAAAAFLASASFTFASASALAFSFSSALRRRRAIASASISCFSHLE